MRKTLYDLLDTHPEASDATLRDAYVRQIAKLRTPPAGMSAEDTEIRRRAVEEAFSVLGDPAQRARYDNSIRPGRAAEVVEFEPPGNTLKWIMMALVLLVFVGGWHAYGRFRDKVEAEKAAAAEVERKLAAERYAQERAAQEEEALKRREEIERQREEYKRKHEEERTRRELDRLAEQRAARERYEAAAAQREEALQKERELLAQQRQLEREKALLRQIQYENQRR